MFSDFMSNFRKPRGTLGALICSMMNMGHGPMMRELVAKLAVTPEMDVLDIGCGGGLAMALMLERALRCVALIIPP